MRYFLIFLTVLALTATAPAQEAEGIRRDDLLALTNDLIQAGQKRLAGEELERAFLRQLKGVWYDEQSLPALAEALEMADDETIRLFVAVNLIKPLNLAATNVVREALPIVKDLHESLSEYRKLPQWTEEELRLMKPPEQKAGESDEAFERRQARAAERLAEKQAQELVVKLHNQTVKRLRMQYVQLLLLADDSQADAEIFDLLAESARQDRWEFMDILSQIRSAALEMEQERAATYYNELEDMWSVESMEQISYVDPGEVITDDYQNPSFAIHDASPGKHILDTINHLASVAKLPALEAPKD